MTGLEIFEILKTELLIVEKHLKAIEIIKKYSNKILFHEWSDNSKTISIQIFEKLNDEEYEILKEVLEK